MKQKISRFLLILHWLGRISFAVLICTIQIPAQQGQQTPPEFPVGVFSTSDFFHTNQTAYNKLLNLGVNYVINQARYYTYTNAQPFNLVAHNTASREDRIYHYTNGMYKRWEAENEQGNTRATGILHRFGHKDFWKGDSCWSTGAAIQAQDELIYGPHYTQDKKYFLIYPVNPPHNKVDFTATFRLAFANIPWNPEDIEVCRLLVVHRMMIMLNGDPTGEYTVDTLAIRSLLVGDFPTDNFYAFDLHYSYADSLLPPDKRGEGMILPPGITYEDSWPETGIEFRVDWSGVGKLYVDYAEVCDDYIWRIYLNDPNSAINFISDYLDTLNRSNIKYWYCVNEPRTVDYYYPMRRIDEIIDSIQPGTHLITEIYQSWNGQVNGDWHLKKYVEPGKTLLRSDYTGNCLQLK